MTLLAESSWPVARLGEAIISFRRDARVAVAIGFPAVSGFAGPEQLDTWMQGAAQRIALEAVAFEALYPDLMPTLAAMGAGIVALADDSQQRFLVCIESDSRHLRLLGPDHIVRSVAIEEMRAAVASASEASVTAEIGAFAKQNNWLEMTDPMRGALLTARLRHLRINVGWLIRPAARGSLREQVREAKLPAALARFLFVHLAGHLAWIAAWFTVGADALQGRLDSGRVMGAGLLLTVFAACLVTADRLHSLFALRLGTLLRRRLLEGAMALDLQSARGAGVGEFLGRIYESHALESLSVAGGLAAITGAIECTAALVIFIWAGATWSLPALLVLFIASCALLVRNYWRVKREWTTTRRELTRRLIESMVGHRTHLVQSNEARWQSEEDRRLAGYLTESRRLDGRMWVLSLVPRGWLLASAAIFGWLFAIGVSTSQLAVSIASLLLAFEGLRHLVQGLPQIAGASIALETLEPMLDAAAQSPNEGNPSVSAARATDGALFDVPLVEAQDLVIRAASGDRTLLESVNLTIRKGDRILLGGASGGGKSTLASVLAGLRHPDRGVLLLGGLDLATLGESAWRQRVSLAAQFHENHLVSATLAFNLLMGRQWPPTALDYNEADTICRELGLGEVLARMPGGLDQMVGESGWQLSHGEKSRIYLARALLQRADLVILDESLAALDPQSFEVALKCALNRAPALVVVAHR